MAELLKRTFPIPMDAIICCGQCNSELWKTKRDISADMALSADLFESHVRPAPPEGVAVTCPTCKSPLGPVTIQWKLPK